MSKKKKVNLDLVAKRLGAKRRGRVKTKAGYFGALQTAEKVRARRARRKKSKNKH